MPDTVSALEFTWTLIAVASIGFTAWILNDNARNYAAIREAVRRHRAVAWGPRWWVALASLVSSAAMMIVWIGFALIGAVAMTTGPNSDVAYRMWVAEISGWVLVAMTLILAAIQVWQVYARTKIRPIPSRSEPATAEDISAAADQTRYAADMVDALRPKPSEQPSTAARIDQVGQSLGDMAEAAGDTLEAAEKTVEAAEAAVEAINDEHARRRADRDAPT